jgi:tetratricopeptide (TPR) repeat protein
MTRFSLAVALVLAVGGSASPSAAVDEIPLFLSWQASVIAHTSGQPDDALSKVWAMGANDRKAVEDHLQDYLDVVADPLKYQDPSRMPPSRDNALLTGQIVIAGRAAAHQFTPRTFLERAAMLHADAVMFDHRAPGAPPPPPSLPLRDPTAPRGTILGEPAQQAREQQEAGFITLQDGEVTGRVAENWNWAFARQLLDRVKPMLPTDPFVAAWYHGTASYLMRHGDFGEVVRHLNHAGEVLPNDARILFDRGTVAESLAMNLFQQIVTGHEASPRFQIAVNHSMVASASNSETNGLPEPDISNARAREFYEKAIAVNPALVEAHVRLARELELDSDFTGALDQVTKALALDPPTEVAFYAHLFGVRAANALGRDDDAERHASAALALYPAAASALLAASHTALHRADPGTAVEVLGRLGDKPVDVVTGRQLDPWQQYPTGAGRMAELALTELWSLTPAKVVR